MVFYLFLFKMGCIGFFLYKFAFVVSALRLNGIWRGGGGGGSTQQQEKARPGRDGDRDGTGVCPRPVPIGGTVGIGVGGGIWRRFLLTAALLLCFIELLQRVQQLLWGEDVRGPY